MLIIKNVYLNSIIDDEDDDDNSSKVIMLYVAELISTNDATEEAISEIDSIDIFFLKFKIFYHLSEFYWCLYEQQNKLFLN